MSISHKQVTLSEHSVVVVVFFFKQNFYRGTEVLCCIDSKGSPSGRHDEVEGDSSRPLLLKDGG